MGKRFKTKVKQIAEKQCKELIEQYLIEQKWQMFHKFRIPMWFEYDQAPSYGSHNKLNKSIHFTLICNGFLLNGLLISTLAVYLPNSVLFWRITSFLAH